MTELVTLESLGLVLPTPWYIFGALVFGLIGWVVWRRGRTSKRFVLSCLGLSLMLYPYAVSDTWLLWLFGAALSAVGLWQWRQEG